MHCSACPSLGEFADRRVCRSRILVNESSSGATSQLPLRLTATLRGKRVGNVNDALLRLDVPKFDDVVRLDCNRGNMPVTRVFQAGGDAVNAFQHSRQQLFARLNSGTQASKSKTS